MAQRSFGLGKTTPSGKLAAGDDQLRHFEPNGLATAANNLPEHAATSSSIRLGVASFPWLVWGNLTEGNHAAKDAQYSAKRSHHDSLRLAP